jgi:hypothetical protein
MTIPPQVLAAGIGALGNIGGQMIAGRNQEEQDEQDLIAKLLGSQVPQSTIPTVQQPMIGQSGGIGGLLG